MTRRQFLKYVFLKYIIVYVTFNLNGSPLLT